MPATPRRDAARNREQILEVARGMRRDGEPLQLNELARRAGLGVGTVYRHFATVQQLTETLVADRFGDLETRAGDITDEDTLRDYLDDALRLLLSDDDFATVATSRPPALDSTREARQRLIAALAGALDRVQSRRHVLSGLQSSDLLLMLCGLAYALRTSGAGPERAPLYTQAFFDGIFTPAG
jgi:AcrR family transcriptional regulator